MTTGDAVGITREAPGEPFYALADAVDDPRSGTVYVPVPRVVGEFVDRFDAGHYPRVSVGDTHETDHQDASKSVDDAPQDGAKAVASQPGHASIGRCRPPPASAPWWDPSA